MRQDDGAHIFVRDLRLQARVGVNPGEQGAEQPIVVDLWVGVDQLDRAARTENLRHTVDYVGVARTARKVVAARHYPLVETLATRIAQAVLERPGTTWARVRLRKLACLRLASAAGAEVCLRRPPDAPRCPQPGALPDEPVPIAIVGGGVAGLSAALWCTRLGHHPLLLDGAQQLGGQLHMVFGMMQDLPAMEPMTGKELLQRFWSQHESMGGRWSRARLLRLEAPPTGNCVLTLQPDQGAGPRRLQASCVILATGVRRRRLGVPGEAELAGRGILATGAKDNHHLRGKHVAIVGGGDSACENALILAGVGARVTLVHRGAELSARAQFRHAVEQQPAIQVLLNRQVARFEGDQQLETLELAGEGKVEQLRVDAALVRVGWVPQSAGLPRDWCDDSGFVPVDGRGRVAGDARVLAAGDLTGRPAPSVATSMGGGATAARSAVDLLEQRAS